MCQNCNLDEKEKKLQEVLNKHKDTKGALIPVLHEAQEIYGYLPLSVQETIANALGVPLSEVYGVVTFYTQFSLYPKAVQNSGMSWNSMLCKRIKQYS